MILESISIYSFMFDFVANGYVLRSYFNLYLQYRQFSTLIYKAK